MHPVASPLAIHPALGRIAVDLEHAIREGAPSRDDRWDEFERAVLDHMHEEEVELLPERAASHQAEVLALLAEHHEIRVALAQGRSALAEGDTRAALLAIASFRMHQIREETGVYQALGLHRAKG